MHCTTAASKDEEFEIIFRVKQDVPPAGTDRATITVGSGLRCDCTKLSLL
jgi:hypothetical protein